VPAYGVRPLVRRPTGKALGIAAAVAIVLGLLYVAARETPLFALRELEISGAPRGVRLDVERAAAGYVGESLVSLDSGALRRRLEALPSVRSLRTDRAFPHTLRLFVVAEKPAAVLRSGPHSWLVSVRGRVIRRLLPGRLGDWPRIRLPDHLLLSSGQTVTDGPTRLALAAVVAVPQDFPVAIRTVRVRDGRIVLILAGDSELRLGERTALALKLVVAARVLRSLTLAERSALGYLDLTVPDHPVAADKSQLST
jgi:cell division protein FtsQ